MFALCLLSSSFLGCSAAVNDTATISDDVHKWVTRWESPEIWKEYRKYLRPGQYADTKPVHDSLEMDPKTGAYKSTRSAPFPWRQTNELWVQNIKDLEADLDEQRASEQGCEVWELEKMFGGYPRQVPIADNSEGIQAYHSLLVPPIKNKSGNPVSGCFEDCQELREMLLETLDFESPTWVDTGAGPFATNAQIIEGVTRAHRQDLLQDADANGVELLTMDPWALDGPHCADTMNSIYEAGGVDVAFSMSVLNVITDREARMEHIRWVHTMVKNGGIAVFKIWAGWGDIRGIGCPISNKAPRQQDERFRSKNEKNQNNKFAREYLDEIREVFDQGSQVTLVDNEYDLKSQNLIWCIKDDHINTTEDGFCRIRFANSIDAMIATANLTKNEKPEDRVFPSFAHPAVKRLSDKLRAKPEIRYKREI